MRLPRLSTRARVVYFPDMERLDLWCAANEVDEAIIGGFFLRDPYRPLGDLWIDGRPVASEPIAAPYGSRRACVVVTGEDILLASRESVPARPEGDLLTAGPLLVRDGTRRLRSRS